MLLCIKSLKLNTIKYLNFWWELCSLQVRVINMNLKSLLKSLRHNNNMNSKDLSPYKNVVIIFSDLIAVGLFVFLIYFLTKYQLFVLFFASVALDIPIYVMAL